MNFGVLRRIEHVLQTLYLLYVPIADVRIHPDSGAEHFRHVSHAGGVPVPREIPGARIDAPG